MEFLTWPSWVGEVLKTWGPAAALLLGFIWYVPRTALASFIKAQQDQAIALHALSTAVKMIADKGVRLEERIDEVILNQRVMVTRVDEIRRLILQYHGTESQE